MRRTLAVVVALVSLSVFGTFLKGALPVVATGTWAPVGNFSAPRPGAASALLPDGRILVMGGADANGSPSASSEFFNPDGTITTAPSMNIARSTHAAMVLGDGRVLVTGGTSTGNGATNTAELFDPSTNSWQTLASAMVEARSSHSMALLPDGNVVVVGGENSSGAVKGIEVFAVPTQQFTFAGALVTPRSKAAVAAVPDGRVLIAGGIGLVDGSVSTLASTEIFKYDPTSLTGSVAAGPNMASARSAATATTTYDGVAVIGGNDGTNDLGTAEIFSQWTNVFRTVTGGTPRSNGIAMLLPHNGSILVTGGTAGTATDLLQPWANNKTGAFIAALPSAADHTDGFITATGSEGLMLAAGGKGGSGGELYRFPTVFTDKADYAPGTTVVMTGTGFQPDETVNLHLHEWVSQTVTDYPDYVVTADASGTFSFAGYAPTPADLNSRYHLTAVGQSSGLQAQTVFTDASNLVSVSVSSQNGSLTYGSGGTATYTVTVTRKGSGNLDVDLSLTNLPAGTSASFSPAKVSFKGNTPTSQTSTLTITTSNSTLAGTTNLTVRGSADATKEGNGTLNISPKSVTPSISAANKIYDGTRSAIVSNCSVATKIGSDDVACSVLPTNATFDTKNVGTTKLVTATGITLTGSTAANYTLSSTIATSAADVTPLHITGTFAAQNKEYDGTTAATLSNRSLVGAISSDSVSLSGGTATFSDKNAAANKVVTLVGASLSGSDAGNYVLDSVSNGQANITIKTVTASIVGTPTKPYDGNTEATLSAANFSLGGLISGESIAVNKTVGFYNSKDVVSASLVTANLSAADFSAGGATLLTNYVLPATASGPGQITAKTVTASIVGTPTKPYDGNTEATLSAANFSLGGLISGESIAVNKTVGFYNSKDVVSANLVTTNLSAADFSAGGATLLTNYVLPATASGPGQITAKTVTASIVGTPTKPYDGNTEATLSAANFSLGGLISGESIAVNKTVGFYNSKDVVSANLVTTNLSAADFSAGGATLLTNYVLPATASGPGQITAKTVTASIVVADKTYDGTTSASITNCSLSGVISPDTTNCLASSILSDNQFSNKNVGIWPVTANNISLVNNGLGNYVLASSTATGQAEIKPATAVVHVSAASTTYTGLPYAGVVACSADGVNNEHPVTTASFVDASNNALSGPPTDADHYAYVCSTGGAGTNYVAGAESAAFVISKANANISVTGYSGTYDGSEHGASGSATGVQGEPLTDLLHLGPKFINVPGGVANWTFDGNKNYNASSGSVQVRIDKAPVTATAGSFSGTYDGEAHSPSECAVAGPYTGHLSCANNPASVGPNAGSGFVTPAVTGSDVDNFEITPINGRYVIDKASSEVTITCPETVVYNGTTQTPCTATATGIGGLNQVVPVTYSNNLNAGSATTNATFEGDINHNGSSNSKTFDIAKASVTATAGGYTGTYDGKSHSLPSCELSGAYLGHLSCANGPDSVGPNVGSGKVTPVVTGTDIDNFTIELVTGAYSIEKAGSTVVLSCPASLTYNGSAQAPCTATATGAGGLDKSVGVTYTGNTNAGTATANAAYEGDDNHTGNSDTKTFDITKALVTATAGSYTGTYDGLQHSPSACEMVGTYTGHLSCSNAPGSVGPAVSSGEVSPVVSGPDLENFEIKVMKGSYSIAKATPVITWSNPADIFYGTALSAMQLNATASVPGSLVYTPSAGTVLNAGEGQTLNVSFTPTDTTNYNSVNKAANINVKKATPVINWSAPTDIYYGTALSKAQLNATANVDGTFAYTPAIGAVLAVGTQQLSVTFVPTDAANFTSATKTVAINILSWTVRGFYQPVSMASGVWNTVKGGSTVPLKFNIYAGTIEKTENTAVKGGSISVFSVPCVGQGVEDPVDFTNTGGTGLRYDGTAGQFIQNWQTPKLSGQCYLVVMTAQDNITSLRAYFKTK